MLVQEVGGTGAIQRLRSRRGAGHGLVGPVYETGIRNGQERHFAEAVDKHAPLDDDAFRFAIADHVESITRRDLGLWTRRNAAKNALHSVAIALKENRETAQEQCFAVAVLA